MCGPILALEAAAFVVVLVLLALEHRARVRTERLLLAAFGGQS